MIWEILFPLFIIMYWACEGVTEGYTFASAKRRKENKLIHPNNGNNGIMDYHAWRIFENLGIWGTVFSAFLMITSLKSFILLGVGSWLIGTFCYEANLNHVFYGVIWKPVDYKWHIFGYDIPWFGGKKSLILVGLGVVIILLGICLAICDPMYPRPPVISIFIYIIYRYFTYKFKSILIIIICK